MEIAGRASLNRLTDVSDGGVADGTRRRVRSPEWGAGFRRGEAFGESPKAAGGSPALPLHSHGRVRQSFRNCNKVDGLL